MTNYEKQIEAHERAHEELWQHIRQEPGMSEEVTDRDELCALISEAVGGWNPATQAITRVADAVLAAGYRKQ